MRAKTLLVSLICLLTVSMAVVNVRALYKSTTIYINPEENFYVPGSTFSVTVNIDSVTNLYGWGFWLSWNPKVLKILSITEGPFLKSGGITYCPAPTIDNNVGYATAGCTLLGVASVSGSGVAATVNLEVLEAGGTTLHLYDTKLSDNQAQLISHNVVDGEFTTGMSANLVARSAWPEHHHYKIGGDEDDYQRLTGKVIVSGPESLYVKVVFDTVRDDGMVYRNETVYVLLDPGIKHDLWFDFGPFVPSDSGNYFVTASAWFSLYGEEYVQGTKIKAFRFAAV